MEPKQFNTVRQPVTPPQPVYEQPYCSSTQHQNGMAWNSIRQLIKNVVYMGISIGFLIGMAKLQSVVSDWIGGI